jgi:phage repressor protein C with HTH and peptisase S24 domain
MSKNPIFPEKIDPSTLGGRIMLVRQKLKITQSQLAQALRVSRQKITDLESGRTRHLDAKTALMFKLRFRIDPAWLITGKGSMFIEEEPIPGALREIKLWGEISAGPGMVPEGKIIGYIPVDKRKCSSEAFGLVVRGDSMEPYLYDGDIVLIDPARPYYSGMIAAVLNKEAWDTAQVKRVVYSNKKKNEVILQSINPKYPPEVLSWNEIHIFGVWRELPNPAPEAEHD